MKDGYAPVLKFIVLFYKQVMEPVRDVPVSSILSIKHVSHSSRSSITV